MLNIIGINQPKEQYHIRLRLIISLVIFILWTIYIFYTHGEGNEGIFFHVWIIPPWLLLGVLIALMLPFIDLIFQAGVLILAGLFVIVVVYGVFLAMPTMAHMLAGYIETNVGKGSIYTDAGTIVFAVIIVLLFSIPYIYQRHKSKQAKAEARTEERISSWKAEEGVGSEKTNVLEKGEIGRVVNYWQQKFNNAENEEERKIANDKIRYYTELLSSLNNAKKGKEVINR